MNKLTHLKSNQDIPSGHRIYYTKYITKNGDEKIYTKVKKIQPRKKRRLKEKTKCINIIKKLDETQCEELLIILKKTYKSQNIQNEFGNV